MTPGQPLPPINFKALADALLPMAETLVKQWLPGAVKRGHEWVCGSLAGEAGSSLSVCFSGANAGRWADFASDERGGDLISLYAAVHGLDAGRAAIDLAHQYGLEQVAGVVKSRSDQSAPPPPPPPPKPARPAKPDEIWRTVMPVRPDAPGPTFWHQYRPEPADRLHTAHYRLDGHTLGYVVRFRKSDGDKETLPYTWCQSDRDGSLKWQWRTWDEPRPLYLPHGVKPLASRQTVVVVEGEIKAEVLQVTLDATAPGVYLVVGWPGGCKAWQKALWEWLAGCDVLLWPDCDAKRALPPREALKAVKDDAPAVAALKAAQPLLPAARQPGMLAMLGIGALLRDAHGCRVQLLPIPEPGAVVDGWDARDAIEGDGWDGARLLEFFGRAQALPEPLGDGGPPPKKIEGPGGPGRRSGRSGGGGDGGGGAGAGSGPDGGDEADDGSDPFEAYLKALCTLQDCDKHALAVSRTVVIRALRTAPGLGHCLGFDLLRDGPVCRMPWPWRDAPGPLMDQDDLRLGDWLHSTYGIRSCSRQAAQEALETVADERRFHPVRDYLAGLKWDGAPRLDKWLIHALGHQPEALGDKQARYLARVGRLILLGHVARVMEPGCKFDYSVVLEGKAGMGKSTLVKVLVGEAYFSDTHFDIGTGKDGYEQIAGLWGYELSEMTAFRRADSEAVKAFFSSQKDRYRGAYGRYVQDHPRQCVIWCTTNKRQYLYDLTGNRRFWPVYVGQALRLSWLAKWRDQLWAEALVQFNAGEAIYPSPEEERELFAPQQRLRLVETSVQSRLWDLLTRTGGMSTEGKATGDLNQNTNFVTLGMLTQALGADAAKTNVQTETQVRDWLLEHGWVPTRETSGARRRGFRQPAVWPPVGEGLADARPAGAFADECPAGQALVKPEQEPERRAGPGGPAVGATNSGADASGTADGDLDDAPF